LLPKLLNIKQIIQRQDRQLGALKHPPKRLKKQLALQPLAINLLANPFS
jgi:hypothetical protein